MGDVSILIDKNGRPIDLTNKNSTTDNTNDNEDEDDITDEEELSGSGSSSIPSTPELPPVITTTPGRQEIKADDSGGTDIAIIAAGVSAALIVVIVVVLFIIFWRRRRRRIQREKSNSLKPLPHPSSMEMSEGSRATLPVRPTGDGYYTAVPLAAAYPPTEVDDLPPPVEPPPPPPSSKKSPNSPSKPGTSARYTKLKVGAASGSAAGNRGATASAPYPDENIYETIDDTSDQDDDDDGNGQVYLVAKSPSKDKLTTLSRKDEEDYSYEETDKLKC